MSAEDGMGTRYNVGKLRWRNFPLFLIRPVIEVAHYGERKYDTYNFLKGLTVNNCLDSLMRHLDKFQDPDQKDVDEESGKHHLAHVAWNALVCLYMVTFRDDLDDRFKKHVPTQASEENVEEFLEENSELMDDLAKGPTKTKTQIEEEIRQTQSIVDKLNEGWELVSDEQHGHGVWRKKKGG